MLLWKKIITDKKQDFTKHTQFTWQQGHLRRKGKLVVGNDESLKIKLMKLFHDTPMGRHSGVYVTVKRLASIIFWRGLWKDVRNYVRGCQVCQKYKPENVATTGLLQPLPVPQGIFTNITMDFVEGFPRSKRKSVVFVVVDRLTKYAHFNALKHPYTVQTVAQLFLDTVYKLHGMPSTIISDRGLVFVSDFCNEMFSLQGVAVQLSTLYHLETDAQTEVVNRCLETYLRAWLVTDLIHGYNGYPW